MPPGSQLCRASLPGPQVSGEQEAAGVARGGKRAPHRDVLGATEEVTQPSAQGRTQRPGAGTAIQIESTSTHRQERPQEGRQASSEQPDDGTHQREAEEERRKANKACEEPVEERSRALTLGRLRAQERTSAQLSAETPPGFDWSRAPASSASPSASLTSARPVASSLARR